MEDHVRRRRRTVKIKDQENVHAVKGKGTLGLPAKKQGLARRQGALDDINTNVQTQRDGNVAKDACATAEPEKKATQNRGAKKCDYSHVQPKVDTGLSVKSTTARPPRSGESSASQAAGAVARTRAARKAAPINKAEKKVTKLPEIKENRETQPLKPILKEQTIHDAVQQQPSIPDLPGDIEDIDADDNDSLLLMSIYVKDIYKHLIELEQKYLIEPEHLRKHSYINGKMRATLIDWLVDVHSLFSLLSETFHLTVGIIDRYLQAVPNIKRNKLQLVGVTAMFIASKYEEVYVPAVEDFVRVTDKAYSDKDIFQCERDIMSKLGFCLARPIPLSFLSRFVKAAHGTAQDHQLAKYFVDLCFIEYSMTHYRPSELAAAAICVSLYLMSRKPLKEVWTTTLVYYSGYPLEHLGPIIKKLAKVVVNVRNSKYSAVYKKYFRDNVSKVACLSRLQRKALRKLASQKDENNAC